MANLLTETLLIGLASGILGLIISTLLMLPSKKFSWKKYDFWPVVFLSFFLTGALFHFICEITGVNKWYCKHGNVSKN